ncbi:MAG: SOS response-associated peptidase [Pyrinomonadaceae bacterium]
MCGRFTSGKPEKIKINGINAADLEGAKPRYNIAPSQQILSVINTSDEKHALYLQWGLIPSWSKEPSGSGIINARAETLLEKPSFRDSFKRRRCLIPADGFYEWKRTGKIKQPYYFQMKDESVFSFAGIWDVWKTDGKEIISCAIITTAPNELLSPIHNRMPAILHRNDFDTWLNNEVKTDELEDLLKPFPDEYMKGCAVGTNVNSPGVDDPQLIEPL